MKTIIKITNDYMSTLSYDTWREDIQYLIDEELNVRVTTSNSRFINPCKSTEYNDTQFDTAITVTAKGYSQGDWQDYTIDYNKNEVDKKYLDQLVKALERSFTHQNDYQVEKFEQTEINGKKFNAEPHDFTSFCVTDVEFPDEEDVLNAYQEIYGKDYNKVIINIQ